MKIKKKITQIVMYLLLFAIFMSSFKCMESSSHEIKKIEKNDIEENYVPNSKTAIKIAEAIWLPIQGDKIIENKPYIAKLDGNIWIVEGSLPEGMKGGVPFVRIQKNDCKILEVTHTK